MRSHEFTQEYHEAQPKDLAILQLTEYMITPELVSQVRVIKGKNDPEI